ncbi:hypothetical protein [Polyangium fumosum]|uniref:Uncharacterized protein n=1 Tax=Polyangium fumosum TaxID=889272 RepID=A0A4U1IVK0_9BACT|nr:hypothetical protein [Polyangium fumosum]TKC98531.1 hypothetical protein E8A74_40960 [Polyangium fumosum]
MGSPRGRTLLSFGFLGCATVALVPLGCGATIRYPADDRPRVPAATAERLRACVDELGGELGGGYYTFDATVTVDEEGGVVDVKSKGVPHPDLAICMRIALRGMTVPEELLRLRKLRLSEASAPANGQTTAERGLVGNAAALVLVVVALADLAIEVGPYVIVVVAASLEIAEVARRRPPPNLNRCLDAAAGGKYMWEEFCRSIGEGHPGSPCWGEGPESEQHKRGWCYAKFRRW